jgi:hypothetical protein
MWSLLVWFLGAFSLGGSVLFLAFPGALVGVLSSAGWVSPLLSLEPGVVWKLVGAVGVVCAVAVGKVGGEALLAALLRA